MHFFPTIVGEAQLDNRQDLNSELAAYIRSCEHKGEDFASISTVVQGWQSGPEFLESDVPAIRRLRSFIEENIDSYLLEWAPAFFDVMPENLSYCYSGWAVILRSGGFQHEHVHARKDIVGIYYVEVPATSGNEHAGYLTLTDPRSGRVASSSIWESTQITLQPKAGKLLIFPGFVPHRVEQVLDPGERISINFDVTVVGLP